MGDDGWYLIGGIVNSASCVDLDGQTRLHDVSGRALLLVYGGHFVLSITKEFSFSASHILKNLPDGHQCGRHHGHNYVVVVELSSVDDQLDAAGFVRDFGELSSIKEWIDDTVDHRHLNDVMDQNPTAENLCRWLFSSWVSNYPELSAVRVSETPKTWAEYRPSAVAA